MRKMKLELERLEVDTFAVTPDGAGADGTVFGRVEYQDTAPSATGVRTRAAEERRARRARCA
jgi:hypothetical protein